MLSPVNGLVAIGITEIIACVFLWRLRKPVYVLIFIVTAANLGMLLGAKFSTWAVLVFIVGLYRLFNQLRVVQDRIQPQYLRNSALRSVLTLFIIQLIIIALSMFGPLHHISSLLAADVLAAILFVIAGVILVQLLISFKLYAQGADASLEHSLQKPSLTVAIPARNETEDLKRCLDSLINSNYPKLEIIVLDDCSQNKRTSSIIKDYAQSGVRFLAGKEPPKNWLAKNYAYQQLADSANGEIILFCGVDCRFKPDSLSYMVKKMVASRSEMESYMPINQSDSEKGLLAKINQTNRYMWELALPRLLFKNRPPVLSTCWLIKSSVLRSLGEFKAYERNILPERHFAGVLNKKGMYAFYAAGKASGLTSCKTFSEQFETAIRMRYPQLHRKPEMVLAAAAGQIAILLLPAILAIYSYYRGYYFSLAFSAAAFIAGSFGYYVVHKKSYSLLSLASLTWMVPAVIYDSAIMHYSMWKYEFSQVLWKGRNICLPIMRLK